jgi:hypothetical protein
MAAKHNYVTNKIAVVLVIVIVVVFVIIINNSTINNVNKNSNIKYFS